MLSRVILVFLNLRQKLQIHWCTWLLSGLFAECGPGSRIFPPLRFANLSRVRLGPRVVINKDCWILTIDAASDDVTVKLDIGRDSVIGMGATISASRSVILGDHVLLARNVYISDHGHAFEDPTRPIMYQGISESAPVTIGRNTWLGQNVVVLPGSVIGQHCVIGANSVVKGTIPDFSVAVGAPAHVVRRLNQVTARWEKISQNSK